MSSNEEFRSTNEELETAKEELQSINEELSTTNDELRYRVRELKDLHADVARSRDFAEAIIETITQPILVLNGDLHVKRVNAAFCRMFSTTAETTLGMRLYGLGNGQWDIPALRELLETILLETHRGARLRDRPRVSRHWPAYHAAQCPQTSTGPTMH